MDVTFLVLMLVLAAGWAWEKVRKERDREGRYWIVYGRRRRWWLILGRYDREHR